MRDFTKQNVLIFEYMSNTVYSIASQMCLRVMSVKHVLVDVRHATFVLAEIILKT